MEKISVTKLKMYLRCPLQYKFRYVDGLKIPPTSSLTLGKSIHSALETNYTQKIESKKDLSAGEVLDLFSARWEKEAKETEFKKDEKPGKIKDDGVKMIDIYHKQVSPTIMPKLVEHEFEMSFQNVGYKLHGYVDLIDTQDVIIDHKTSKRSMSEKDVVSDLQLTCYALACRNTLGIQEKALRFDIMVRNKKAPKIQQLTTQRTAKDIDRFLKILAYVSKAIESGIFYPNTNFMCGICGYRLLCRKWA